MVLSTSVVSTLSFVGVVSATCESSSSLSDVDSESVVRANASARSSTHACMWSSCDTGRVRRGMYTLYSTHSRTPTTTLTPLIRQELLRLEPI